MAIYKIKSFANSALALSVSTSGSGNVCLLNDTGASNQRWNISSLGTKVSIQSRQNSGYLNADTSSSNCDISSTLISYVTFNKTTENVYRIQLWNNGIKYLTCDGTTSGSNVSWKTITGGANQLWGLIEEPTEKILEMPKGPLCNWNQKNAAVTKYFGEGACTLVSGLDVSNFYATNADGYTPKMMYDAGFWNKNSGYNWGTLAGKILSKIANKTQEQFLAIIRETINKGYPCIVTIGYSANPSHTVFAYGYKSGGETYEDICVYDPANMDTSDIKGLECNLYEAMDHNHDYFNIFSVRPTEK